MKNSVRVTVLSAAVAASMLLIVSPAVADPWPAGDSVTVGGTEWHVRNDGASIGHTYAEAGGFSQTIHEFGSLEISGWAPYCDTDTAVTTTDVATGDVVITCDAQESSSDSGLFVTPQYRFYAGGDLARMFFTIENRSGADITASDFFLFDNYDCYEYYHSSSGLTGSVPAADDTWVMTTAPSCMVGGTAWAVAGNTTTTTSGDISDEQIDHDFVDLVFPAGSTKYVASFAISGTPTDSDVDSATAALDTAVAAATQFDTFSGRLVAGLPKGITVINWGATTAAAKPALAATGVDQGNAGFVGLLAGTVALAGLTMLVVRRRTIAG